jgi:hypothetical protein
MSLEQRKNCVKCLFEKTSVDFSAQVVLIAVAVNQYIGFGSV